MREAKKKALEILLCVSLALDRKVFSTIVHRANQGSVNKKSKSKYSTVELNSCEKMSKICQIILLADVFKTKENLAKYSTAVLIRFFRIDVPDSQPWKP